jgi:hypothetical protein
MASTLFILVPLYIYPLERAWEPLLEAARAHPNVQFLAVINPSNGPGETPLPDASYAAAMRELSGVPNIKPLGYVYCSYGNRAIDAVKGDVDIFHGWNSEFRLEGIFIDEAPSQPDLTRYMRSISDYAHTRWQAALGRPGIVVYNPGVVPNQDYYSAADLVVSFEQSESHWEQLVAAKQIIRLAPDISSKNVAVVHTFDDSHGDLTGFVSRVRDLGFGGIFITDQEGGGYNRWPQAWQRLVEFVDTDNAAR